ncbi:pali-domain-containing protein [Punctularia strigosozonata HHB-11173 SS5]|uniref:pali-domain-containing protein n=1 Tax=Punctularia strigosozonata (strain HHB-11173) TaxID=741275 RepID=UPI0004416FDE|nr:pali-domain-containing protein [Punctularia strigosozonata HHB-11173 SS5]EIN12013.1 pali-domain-containing protein [Punctularia strigosozonata HHB-11173 SS5]
MGASAAYPGLFFCFAAMVLLIFVSVGAPTWDKIGFLKANIDGTKRFGVFGYTGTSSTVGWHFQQSILGFDDHRLNHGVVHNLTFVLILLPIAAGLSGLAVLFGLCGAHYHRSGTVFMSLAAALATLCTLVGFIIELVLFGIAEHEFHKRGFSAKYDNATWMTLGALVALLVGWCTSLFGVFGHYRRRRAAYPANSY